VSERRAAEGSPGLAGLGGASHAGSARHASGGTAVAVAADVTGRVEYQSMVERLLGEYGRWDVLVNNAAVAVTKPFPQITEQEFDLSFAVNVKGVFHGLQLAWEHLADGGRIITISSSTTALMLQGYAVYDATKGAVEQLTHILSKEFGPRRITVNAVSPGATETETYRAGKSEQFLAGLEAMSAFGRLGQPAEIAARRDVPGQRRRGLGSGTEHPRELRHRMIGGQVPHQACSGPATVRPRE
jgi:3-oxoacyl-[acyl-carrier protein] reductase